MRHCRESLIAIWLVVLERLIYRAGPRRLEYEDGLGKANSQTLKRYVKDSFEAKLEAPSEVPQTGRLLRHNLSRSMGDGGCFGAMVGVGETFIPAYALAVGMGETSAGLVASIPVAAGGIMQLESLRMMHWFKSEQRWVVLCASVQALAFLPLVLSTLWGGVSFSVLLLITAIYWASGLASGPAWNTWMESIVPPGVRASYFAKRSRFQQSMTFFGLLAGGVLLQYAQKADAQLLGFTSLFVLAACFRFMSVAFLATHRKDGRWQNPKRRPDSVSDTDSSSGARLLTYLVFVQVFVQLSGPYFAPYLLKELRLDYLSYTFLLAVAFLFRIAALSFWSSVANRFGAATLMWIGAIALVPLAPLWIISDSLVWLTLVQATSGTAWAAYELGFFLLFFETLPPAKRTKLLTYYNLGNSLALFVGASLGALLLSQIGFGPAGYFTLFAISSTGRLLALGLLRRVRLRPVPIHRVAIRVLGIRPATASLDVPVLPSLNDDADTD